MVTCAQCPLSTMSVSSALQVHREISLSLPLSPFPPRRHLQGLSFHVWLLFSLSTKLTTRNVKLCKVSRLRGKSWCQPAPCLCGVCLQRGVQHVKNSEKTRGNGLIRADGCMEMNACASLCPSLHVCVRVCLCVCVCVCVASGGLLARGQGGSQDGFVRSQGLCCAPLGSRLLFQDATCWGMYSAHSFDGPSAQVH